MQVTPVSQQLKLQHPVNVQIFFPSLGSICYPKYGNFKLERGGAKAACFRKSINGV